ncbi:MAG: hypothetical protein HQM13_18420 [SAR324 cluster bacterium]|nr:hypothetical protein [SAR324 cluster bacterium]
MVRDLCFLCEEPLPEGQSFYEDHEVKVCLPCFRDTPRCKKCKFPSHQLEVYPGLGEVCEFCRTQFEKTGMTCYLCHKNIPSWMSFYSDYEKNVCQECFSEADRCFLCRFPQSSEHVPNLGHVCEFCQNTILREGDDLGPILDPLKSFLKQYHHQASDEFRFQWTDWNLILGMQIENLPKVKIKFFDEFLHFAYPVYFLKGTFYLTRCIPRQHFMAHFAGQLAAADICRVYKQAHLLSNSPFAQLARGWCHWVAYSTARILKYKPIQKQLSRWPEQFQDDFQKFQAMDEYKKPKEIIAFAQGTLREYAMKYL